MFLFITLKIRIWSGLKKVVWSIIKDRGSRIVKASLKVPDSWLFQNPFFDEVLSEEIVNRWQLHAWFSHSILFPTFQKYIQGNHLMCACHNSFHSIQTEAIRFSLKLKAAKRLLLIALCLSPYPNCLTLPIE